MAKRKSTTYMTYGEQIAGVVFFVIYLLVLPFAAAPLFGLAERLLDTTISGATRNALYYYVLFAVTVIIFHGFLARTSRRLLDNPGLACKTAAVGLVGLYGLNELAYRLTNLIFTIFVGSLNIQNMAIGIIGNIDAGIGVQNQHTDDNRIGCAGSIRHRLLSTAARKNTDQQGN